MAQSRLTAVLACAALPLLLQGCSHAPQLASPFTPAQLLQYACAPGATVKSVKGSLQLKVRSEQGSGQFPATVDVSGPDAMRLEISNLIGGTEAVISIQGRHYALTSPTKKLREQEGYNSWYGIPLDWAADLFLGRIPCPSPEALRDARLSRAVDGTLIVETSRTLERDAQRFVYSFRSFDDVPWPESLHWQTSGRFAASVDFSFDDPERGTHSPQKWEARSAQGDVKAHWRDRNPESIDTRLHIR